MNVRSIVVGFLGTLVLAAAVLAAPMKSPANATEYVSMVVSCKYNNKSCGNVYERRIEKWIGCPMAVAFNIDTWSSQFPDATYKYVCAKICTGVNDDVCIIYDGVGMKDGEVFINASRKLRPRTRRQR